MSIDQATALISTLIQVALKVAGPVLGAVLLGGVLIGVVQTATQINEMALAYVVKMGCVLLVFALVGPALADEAARYAHAQITAVAQVVRASATTP